MERYAPNLKDLASRDVVSRSMDQEIKEGRGCGSEQGPRAAEARPPRARRDQQAAAVDPRDRAQVRERRSDQGADPGRADDPLPDGRHSDQHPRPGRSRRQAMATRTRSSTGFYAVGECACVSVHGANRLGTNSLLDLLVFGRAAGELHRRAATSTAQSRTRPAARCRRRCAARGSRASTARHRRRSRCRRSRSDLRKTMQAHCGVFRNEQLLSEGVRKVMELEERAQRVR